MTTPEAGARELLREAVLGFVFWCLFQALAPMIWFFPLNLLEISGYEALAVFLFSPILLAIPPLKRQFSNRWCMAVLRLVSAGALLSFQAPSTLTRLYILVIGCFTVMLVFTLSLFSPSPYQRSVSCWGLVLGLFIFLSSRVWFTTFVPTWWDLNTNIAVTIIATTATLDKIFSGDDGLPTEDVGPAYKPSSFRVGLGFGSLLYLTQAVFGEVSLLSRWTVAGYPDPGPPPYPYGAVVLCSLWVGVMMSSLAAYRNFISGPTWWIFGTLGFVGLYYLQTWQAFSAGLILAIYVGSIWPFMIEQLTVCSPALTVTLGAFVWLLEFLFSVWTVAYNFVPGGVYTREHTDWLIAAVMLFIGFGLFGNRKPEHKSQTAFVTINKTEMPGKTFNTVLLLITLIGLGGFASRLHKQDFEHPEIKHPKADFNAAIWTYHFGYDNEGWPSLERSAQMLENTGADVITLLESDASKPFLGNHDLGMWLGERLGMYVDFGVSTRDHTWGNLLLSKYPIIRSKHHLLPSPHGELAPAITATVNMTGHLVDFVVTHMGNDRDVLDRELQAKVLSEELKNAENPVVFLGYVTSAPNSRDYKKLTKGGNVLDIDKTDSNRWCEYIFYRGLIKLGYVRVSHGHLSDTEVQMARFRFPENPDKFEDNEKIVTNPEKVVDEYRFTDSFGDFYRGHYWAHNHHYHMDTPKYFSRS